jgi:hypothetical protein
VRKAFEAVKILNFAFLALAFSVTYKRKNAVFSIFSHLLWLSGQAHITPPSSPQAGRLSLPA